MPLLTGSLLFLVVTFALFAAAIWTHLELRRAVRSPPDFTPKLETYPSLTIIRPVRGLDPGARDNVAAALNTGYPGEVETIFVFDDDAEPALPIVRDAIANHLRGGRHGDARAIISGTPPPFRTGKLHAMIAGLREAKGELIAFGDSDTRPDRLAVSRLVEKLVTTPNAGAAFAPVVAVSDGAVTAGDVGAALALNGLYGPSMVVAERKRGYLPFIMGQLMVFRREALAAIGGLESIRGELVDDMSIGLRLTAAGYLNVVSTQTLPIVVGGTTLIEFARVFRRWVIFSRSGLPGWEFNWPHWLRGGEFFLALGLTIGSAHYGHPAAALVPAATLVAFGWTTVRLHRDLGGGPVSFRYAWVPFALALTAPIAIVSAILHPQVKWRGRNYKLNVGSRLNAVQHHRHA